MTGPLHEMDITMPASASRGAPNLITTVAVTVHVDGPAVEAGRDQLPLGIHGGGRYAIRRGVDRYLDMLQRLDIRATFFVCGYDLERWPELFRQVHAAGHELAAHGYRHEGWDLGETEPELLRKTHQIIIDTVGQAPVGWCSPSGRKSAMTLPTLRRLGYVYDASEKDLDAPYLQDDFVILPNNTVSLDDAPAYRAGQALASEIYDNWVQEFEALRRTTGYVHLTVHPRGELSGRPGRAAMVERFLAHMQSFDNVVFLPLRDIASRFLAA